MLYHISKLNVGFRGGSFGMVIALKKMARICTEALRSLNNLYNHQQAKEECYGRS